MIKLGNLFGDWYFTRDDIERLKKRFDGWRPGPIRRILWFFWPTMTTMEWGKYQLLKKEGAI